MTVFYICVYIYIYIKHYFVTPCGHTKSKVIVNEVLALGSVKEIVNMLNLNMLAGYINGLSLCSEVSVDSNHICTKLFPNTLKYWSLKCDVEGR